MRLVPRSINTSWLTAGVLLACATGAHGQQRVPGLGMGSNALVPPAAVNRIPNASQNGSAGLPSDWVEQLQEMRPAQQQRFLKNNLRFRSLPPQQQALIRRRLRAWNSLTNVQREAVLERQQIWEQLPPEQRRQVRESLLPRWQILSVPRRQIILGKLRELRGLDGAQRSAMLNDEDFLGSMNEEDRQMLRDLSSLGVGQVAG